MRVQDRKRKTVWNGVASSGGALAAVFATLCCLGVTSALSFASAVGATFLTHDASLKPFLVAALTLTAIGSVFGLVRHRNPVPLLITGLAGTAVYLFTFQIKHASDCLVWLALAAFVGTQIWDVTVLRRRCDVTPGP